MDVSYGQVFRMNFALFGKKGIGLEIFRQWLVVVGSAFTIPFLIVAIAKVRGFTRKFTFDIFVLCVEAVKVTKYS